VTPRVADLTTNDGFVPALPIGQYRYTLAETHLVTDATNLLIHQCMQRLGYSWSVPRVAQPTDDAIQRTIDSRRYGLTSLTAARMVGYHWPYSASAPSAEPKLDAAGQTALLGPSADRTKPGGCAGAALRTLGDNSGPDPAGQLAAQAFAQAQQDPGVQAAFRGWSRCIAAAGYAYRTPLESIADKRWATPVATALEKRVAAADVRCAQTERLDRIWQASEVHFEQAGIRASYPAIALEASRHRAILSAARRVLGLR